MDNNLGSIVKIFEETRESPRGYDLYKYMEEMKQVVSNYEQVANKAIKKEKTRRFFRGFKSRNPYDSKIKKLGEGKNKFRKDTKNDSLDKQEKKLSIWRNSFKDRCLKEIGEIQISFRDILEEDIQLRLIDMVQDNLRGKFIRIFKIIAEMEIRLWADITPFKYAFMNSEDIGKSVQKEFNDKLSPTEKEIYKDLRTDLEKVLEKYIDFSKKSRFFQEKIKQKIEGIRKFSNSLQ